MATIRCDRRSNVPIYDAGHETLGASLRRASNPAAASQAQRMLAMRAASITMRTASIATKLPSSLKDERFAAEGAAPRPSKTDKRPTGKLLAAARRAARDDRLFLGELRGKLQSDGSVVTNAGAGEVLWGLVPELAEEHNGGAGVLAGSLQKKAALAAHRGRCGSAGEGNVRSLLAQMLTASPQTDDRDDAADRRRNLHDVKAIAPPDQEAKGAEMHLSQMHLSQIMRCMSDNLREESLALEIDDDDDVCGSKRPKDRQQIDNNDNEVILRVTAPEVDLTLVRGEGADPVATAATAVSRRRANAHRRIDDDDDGTRVILCSAVVLALIRDEELTG